MKRLFVVPILIMTLVADEDKWQGDIGIFEYEDIKADVRVLAATNRPLTELRVGDRFRDDLFFRLRYFLLFSG